MPSRFKNQSGRPARGKNPLLLEKARSKTEQVRQFYENPATGDDFFQDLAQELEGDPSFALFFLDHVVNLGESWSGPLLQQLEERLSSKPLRRMVKGGIYQLRQRGMVLPDVNKEEEGRRGILRHTETQAPEAYLSDFDNLGHRLLALTIPRVPQGRVLVFGLIHWDRGLEDLSVLEVSKKQVKTLLEETGKQAGKRFLPVEAGHGVFLLREAHDLAGRLKPEDEKVYAVLTNYLETMGPFPPEPISRSFPGGEGPGEQAQEWDWLKNVPELIHLRLPPEEMAVYARPLAEIRESPLVLSPAQQEDRIREVIAEAVAAVFPEERLGRLVRFLEEIATLYWLKGFPEQAGGILSALRSFQREQDTQREPGHPLLTWLVQKEFLPSEEVAEDRRPPREERTEGGLILPAWVKK